MSTAPPHAESSLEGPCRRPQPPRPAGVHVRSDRSGHGLAFAPAANPGGHPSIRQTAVTAVRHSVEPCTPALMDAPGTNVVPEPSDVSREAATWVSRSRTVRSSSAPLPPWPCRIRTDAYTGRAPDKGGRWSTQRSNKRSQYEGGSRSASRCPILPGRRRPRHRRTPPTAHAFSSGGGREGRTFRSRSMAVAVP